MRFEWDPAKDSANMQKHGFTFDDAQLVFDDPQHLKEESTRSNYSETRMLAIGRLGSVIVTVIFTDRQEVCRIISARRAGEMSESDIVRVRRLSDGTVLEELPDGSTRPYVSPTKTDWVRVEAMTEEEIETNALSDPDNPPLTDEELARMRPVPNPRRIRERLKLTQEQFATRFEVPLGTLRDWEQGARFPDSAARTLLRVIDKDPSAVINALARTYLPPVPASPDSRS